MSSENNIKPEEEIEKDKIHTQTHKMERTRKWLLVRYTKRVIVTLANEFEVFSNVDNHFADIQTRKETRDRRIRNTNWRWAQESFIFSQRKYRKRPIRKTNANSIRIWSSNQDTSGWFFPPSKGWVRSNIKVSIEFREKKIQPKNDRKEIIKYEKLENKSRTKTLEWKTYLVEDTRGARWKTDISWAKTI